MSAKGISTEILDCLASEFERFCHALIHRRTEPRVRRNKVENKTRVEITDVLISTFTREHVVEVAVEVLRQIDCHQAADDLGENARVNVLQSLSKEQMYMFGYFQFYILHRLTSIRGYNTYVYWPFCVCFCIFVELHHESEPEEEQWLSCSSIVDFIC
uniref:Pyrin domain-containing protein n=1 Tax=Sphaeramia orbicularis TaxID=375764 RepID=A0A673A3A0_9TELE